MGDVLTDISHGAKCDLLYLNGKDLRTLPLIEKKSDNSASF
jgi:hypothetical protein